MTSGDTMQLGRLIGANAPGGTVIALRGGLGAGKTTLCTGIGEGLGIREEITSPTYTIISEYEGRLKFFHMDAYRLDSLSDFRETGGLDMLGMPDSLCAMEWSERLPEIAKDDTTLIEIHVGEDGSREFSIKGKWLEDLLA